MAEKEAKFKRYNGTQWEDVKFPPAAHTHSEYLTSHQSLANYYTKTEVDTAIANAITNVLNTPV